MALVRLKEKGQVTIPAPIRDKIAASVGDYFEVSLVGDSILLMPARLVPVDTQPVDIANWVGKGAGHFASVDEMDAFIAAERASWD